MCALGSRQRLVLFAHGLELAQNARASDPDARDPVALTDGFDGVVDRLAERAPSAILCRAAPTQLERWIFQEARVHRWCLDLLLPVITSALHDHDRAACRTQRAHILEPVVERMIAEHEAVVSFLVTPLEVRMPNDQEDGA